MSVCLLIRYIVIVKNQICIPVFIFRINNIIIYKTFYVIYVFVIHSKRLPRISTITFQICFKNMIIYCCSFITAQTKKTYGNGY